MIKIAKELGPDSITYMVQDCTEPLPDGKQFDVVSATFLLQHAKNYEMLLKFLQSIHSMLKPGGKVIGMMGGCADTDHISAGGVLKKDSDGNFTIKFMSEQLNEFEIGWYTEIDETQGIESKAPCMFIKKQTYEKAFKEAGFESLDLFKAKVPDQIDSAGIQSLAKVFQSKDTAFFYFFYAEKPSD
jgi:SAM-dependent methyltransferase